MTDFSLSRPVRKFSGYLVDGGISARGRRPCGERPFLSGLIHPGLHSTSCTNRGALTQQIRPARSPAALRLTFLMYIFPAPTRSAPCSPMAVILLPDHGGDHAIKSHPRVITRAMDFTGTVARPALRHRGLLQRTLTDVPYFFCLGSISVPARTTDVSLGHVFTL